MIRLLVSTALVSAAMAGAAAADWLNPPLAGASRPPAEAPLTPTPHPAAAVPSRAAVPSAPRQEERGLRAQASRFIDFYWDAVDDSGAAALGYLRTAYAPVVDYYGRATRKSSILGDKARYLRRWPDRSSWPAASSAAPQIACEETSAECAISGTREFANGNPMTGAHAAGRFVYAYRVRFGDNSAQIVAERSNVLAREWR